MNRRTFGTIALGTALAPCSSASAFLFGKKYKKPGYLSPFDFATNWDLFYSRIFQKYVRGDRPAKWKLLDDVASSIGDTVGNALDAGVVAGTLNTSFPLDGQKAAKKINDLVIETAEILKVPAPNTFIRQDATPNAYVAGPGSDRFLVFTSGLLNLFEDEEEELRFVIGHELGHLKCEHLKALHAVTAINSLLQNITPGTAFDAVLPTIGLGLGFTWNREAEISADRAGLLACQDLSAAEGALMRLLHGLKRDSSWLTGNFDAEVMMQQFERWESAPFTKLLRKVQAFSATHPFVDQRIAALRVWGKTTAMEKILDRDTDSRKPLSFTVREARLASSSPSDPILNDALLKFSNGSTELFTLDPNDEDHWKDIDKRITLVGGQPLFVEVWDKNLLDVANSRTGVAMFRPSGSDKEISAEVFRNADKRSDVAASATLSLKTS